MIDSSQTLSELPTIPIRHIPVKRLFDIVLSVALLILCIPIFILISLRIRFSTQGKAIYSHERVGRGGKPFQCYKFRTMHFDADARLKKLLKDSPELRKEWEQSRKLKQDPRIVPIGRFLRKTSLDELPQLWNVLKGDLSIVGPRPVMHEEIVLYIGPKASKILSVRPGLTGIWQVSGRNDTSYSTRIALDERYVDNQSFLLDLKLILKTIPSMLFSKGAY